MATSVWIAGIGAVSSAGGDAGSHLETFRRGDRLAAGPPLDGPIACPTFPVLGPLPELEPQLNHSRTLRLAIQAVTEALANARIDRFSDHVRVGVCLGTTVACQLNSVDFYDAFRKTGQAPLQTVRDYLHVNLAHAVSRILDIRGGIRGPRMTIVNACSSGTDAIGMAAAWIRAGLCDLAIAGGADELHRVPMAGFWSLGVMSQQPCAPFDRDRSGLNLGEGAGVLVLESGENAQARGATHSFQVSGFGSASDAHHLTAPHPEGRGLEAAIRGAMSQAKVQPSDIGFINAHGTATLDNDRTESKVIARLFGDRTPFLSTKGHTGHTLGAAGGLEAVFTVLGLREGWIPASAGFQNHADDVPVSPVREATPIRLNHAISTSLAFGGNNSALLIQRAS